MKNKLFTLIISATIFGMALFAQSPVRDPTPALLDVDFQICGDENHRAIAVYEDDISAWTAQWTAEGCTDCVFKPTESNEVYVGFGYKAQLAQ